MLLLLISSFAIVLYFYGTRNYNYWKKRGVPFEKPTIFFGSYLKTLIERKSYSERNADFYRNFPNEKYVGYFRGNRPAILIRDPELIKCILVNDFRYFHYRGANPIRHSVEPLFKNILTGDGDIWKLMRQKLTPAFTTARLKAMFPLIIELATKLLHIIDRFAATNEEVDVRDLMARYATDFVGACGFGIDSDSLNDESSDFRKLGKRVVVMTKRDVFVTLLKRTAPELFKNWHFFAPEIETKTFSIIKQIMSQRNYEPSGRNDFIDMMLELRKQKKIVGESVEKFQSDGSPDIVELEIDDTLLAAQIFLFFIAGFETSSSASSFLLHMLAYYPKEQQLCQEEIDRVIQKYDGKLCFDAVKEMKYLEMAFKESIRILPSPGFLARNTARNFTLPGTNLTLEKETFILISLQGLHHDEKYFKDPEEFRPERFSPENISTMTRNVYMPFGDGPRSCIGERMGVMQSLAGVATILSKFSVSPSPNSIRTPLIDPNSMLLQNISGGLPLLFTRRQ